MKYAPYVQMIVCRYIYYTVQLEEKKDYLNLSNLLMRSSSLVSGTATTGGGSGGGITWVSATE